MGCFGIFSLLQKKKKKAKEQAPSTPNYQHRIYTIPNVPVQAYQPWRRTEVYETPQFRTPRNDFNVQGIVRRASRRILDKAEPQLRRSRLPRRASNDSSKANAAKDEGGSSKTQTQSRKPWNLTGQQLRREFESCQTNPPRIDDDFLWQDRRDSLEEESILAAKGQVSSQAKSRRGCKSDCLCPRCLAQLFEEHKRPLINIQPLQDPPKPSRIPGPSASTRSDSYSSSSSSRASSRNSSPDRTNKQAYKQEIRGIKSANTSDSESAKGKHQGRWNINRYSLGMAIS